MLRSDQTKGLVGRYVATDSFAGRSLRSDRLVRRSVATQRPTEWLGWSLRSDRLVRRLVVTWRPCLDPFLTFYENVLGDTTQISIRSDLYSLK